MKLFRTIEFMKFNANSFRVIAVNCIWLFLLFTTSAFSQQSLSTIKEEGFELTPELSGTANYSYYLDKSKRIYHGPFYFNSSNTDSIETNFVIGREFTGHYKDGLKNDNWTFSQMQLKDDGDGMAVREPKYTIVHNSSGLDFLVQAKFDAGQAKGKWSAGNFEIVKGKVVDTLFFSEANFAKNQFVGDLLSNNEKYEVSGKLNDSGFFTGVWIFKFKGERIIEKRQFEEGVLVNHFVVLEGKELSLNHYGLDLSFDSEKENWDTLVLNEDYLNILKYVKTAELNDNKSLFRIIEKSNDFLLNSLRSFNGFDYSIWNNTEGSDDLIFPKIKVRKFPYEYDEKSKLESANEKLSSCESIIEDYLSDPQVSISKYSIENVSLYYSAYQIYQVELAKLRRLLDVLLSESAHYLNKKEFIPVVFPGTVFPSIVNYKFNDEARSEVMNFPQNLSIQEVTIENLVEHIFAIDSSIHNKNSIISPIIKDSKKRAEIAGNEEVLVLKKDSIVKLFGNFYNSISFNTYHARYAENVIKYVEDEFKKYAQKSVEDRIVEIESKMACFQGLIDFYDFLDALPKKIKEIELLYTRTVWNPFTFTDMDEIVKERVYNSYDKIIIPYLLNELESSEGFNKIDKRMRNFNIVFNRMNALRNEDTQILEGKLKRLTAVQDVLREFELNLLID